MNRQFLIGILSAVVGAMTTYIFAVLKLRRELEYRYDTDLREKRIPQYLELWKLLEPLAKYARPGPVTLSELAKLTASLRQWYFEKGGLFLSDQSRDAYFALQEAIKEVLAQKPPTDVELSSGTFETLRESGSSLRTALTRDIGSRKAPRLN